MYIMRYLIGTQDYHMVYDGRISEGLIAHTDSDWAGDPIKTLINHWVLHEPSGRHSLLAVMPAKRQFVLSSTEAKYMAMFGHLSTNCMDSVPVPGTWL